MEICFSNKKKREKKMKKKKLKMDPCKTECVLEGDLDSY